MNIMKYRAWDINKQIMIDWDTIVKKRNLHDLMDDPHVMLMPFTGMYDQDKNEIYDKDIVIAMLVSQDNLVFNNNIGLVTYCDFEWNLEMKNVNWPVASWCCVEKCKILGNIFESDILVRTIIPNIQLTE